MEITDELSAEQISAYLHKNPQFFEQHPALLADMYLPSPHGSGTVSLAERQQLAQRDRIRVLDYKFAELIKFGKENDIISDKVHRLSLGLLATQTFPVLVQFLSQALQEDFQIPHVGIRLWAAPKNSANSVHAIFQPVEAELKTWTQDLIAPYCGSAPALQINHWFDENVSPKSFALIALRGEAVFGLLALASDDEKRFYPDMGTTYVKRIGELVSAALLRYTV